MKRHILAIVGSASRHSSNERLLEYLAGQMQGDGHVTLFRDLKALPPFDPEQSLEHPPQAIVAFREAIDRADGVIICTPEYVFSIPSGLKKRH